MKAKTCHKNSHSHICRQNGVQTDVSKQVIVCIVSTDCENCLYFFFLNNPILDYTLVACDFGHAT